MSPWVPYLSLVTFPLSILFPFNLVAFSWGFHHGNDPMPPETALRSKKIDEYGIWLREFCLLIAVLVLTIHNSVPFSRIGLCLTGWRGNLAIGVGAGVLQMGLQGAVWKWSPIREGLLVDDRLLRGSIAEWTISNLFSVFSEELWIALSVVTLRQTGHSIVTSLVLVGSVFGAAHYQYRLGSVASALYGVTSASLFLWRGSLLSPCILHYVGNVGALYWARRAQRWKQM